MRKRTRSKYSLELINSPEGVPIYRKWLRVTATNCCEEFKDFDRFYAWCMETGYTEGATLNKRNRSEPYSPENCYFVKLNANTYGDECRAAIKLWNDTVNRIRKACGMPLLGELEEEP